MLVVADLAQLLGWNLYASQTGDWTAPLLWYDMPFLLLAAVLGWIGLR